MKDAIPSDHRRNRSGENDRALLIALNAQPALSRAAICAVAADPHAWLGATPPAEPTPAAREPTLSNRTLALVRTVARAPRETAQRELEEAARLGASIVTLIDPEYPDALRELPQPPPVLYCRGTVPDSPAVAIVGPRRPDAHGLAVAEGFSAALARHAVAIVSGFARGVDIAAHRGALEAGGETVAVLGCGLGVAYPSGHYREQDRIAAAGAVITEFPCGYPPGAHTFPVRNRIIAAIAASTLVVQATSRSGALITARHALELGRDVHAVPGPIWDRRYSGSNRLLRDGALFAEDPDDILISLPLALQERLAATALGGPPADGERLLEPDHLPPLQGDLLRLLPVAGRSHLDELARRSAQPAAQVLAALLELELAGLVTRHSGSTYCRTPCRPARGGGSLPGRDGRRE